MSKFFSKGVRTSFSLFSNLQAPPKYVAVHVRCKDVCCKKMACEAKDTQAYLQLISMMVQLHSTLTLLILAANSEKPASPADQAVVCSL
jgi:hypothetical protein